MSRRESPGQIANAFLEHSPRPKPRKASVPKPGARKGPASVIWVTEDTRRQLALIRGLNVRHVLDFAAVTERARWSVAAKGFVVPSADLADIAAAADHTGTPYRVKQVNAHSTGGGDAA